jgi:membrane fusion protein, multidrug efflux system
MNSVFKNPLVKVLPYVLGFWLLAFLIEACVSKADDLSNKPVADKPSVVYTPVDGVVVQPSEINEELEVTGTLVANQQVDIASELTRKVVRVNVKEGSKVKEGTLLFQLDDADLQAQLERYRQQ